MRWLYKLIQGSIGGLAALATAVTVTISLDHEVGEAVDQVLLVLLFPLLKDDVLRHFSYPYLILNRAVFHLRLTYCMVVIADVLQVYDVGGVINKLNNILIACFSQN